MKATLSCIDNIHVRWYTPGDLATMARIHKACVPHEHWTEKDFVQFSNMAGQIVKVIALTSPKARTDPADVTTTVIGTLLVRHLPGVDIHVLARVCVQPNWQRNGIGTKVVRELVEHYTTENDIWTARVREHNLAAQKLLLHTGFKYTRTVPRFFVGDPQSNGTTTHEDAYWFQRANVPVDTKTPSS